MTRCTCAGTAPGYPQHEDGCELNRSDDEPPPAVLAPADSPWVIDPTPWTPTGKEPF